MSFNLLVLSSLFLCNADFLNLCKKKPLSEDTKIFKYRITLSTNSKKKIYFFISNLFIYLFLLA